jgi:alpha-galactosidase
MNKKTFLSAFFYLMTLLPIYAGRQCYAYVSGDTLKIGNAVVERAFLWNNGALKTVALINKRHGTMLRAIGANADFVISKTAPDSASWEAQWVPTNGVHPEYFRVSVFCRQGALSTLRCYRLYEDCPAIACDTYLKGNISLASNGDNNNNADRKNIESTTDMSIQVRTPTLDRLQLTGNHWQTRCVEFFDYTDWNDNLTVVHDFIPYRRNGHRGNLLFSKNEITGQGFFFLKEAPCSSTQLHYSGADFVTSFNDFMVVSLGVSSTDVTPDSWIRIYGCVTGVWQNTEKDALQVLRCYQKQLRLEHANADEMIMLNTWGDRSQDAKINETFCLNELDRAARLGVTVFQLDDGWQSGKSPNSKTAGGTFKDIWKKSDYWMPDFVKFPRGLKPIVQKGRRLGIRIGLWFNPSVQNNFADWQKDADVIIGLYRKYGIDCFKIDGLQIPTKKAEENLRKLFDKVSVETDYQVIFNLDATAGRRSGYHFMNEYGNIFLENRYTDWGNYYPYRTLRNLWQLSRYVPAEKLQVEFLNKWRNADKYPPGDNFAPWNYSFDYLFAITIAAQPLAWMEVSNLPEEAFSTSWLITKYKTIQHAFHKGLILPIGEEPNGRAWTGFQSMTSPLTGYMIVYREDNDRPSAILDTYLERGDRIKLKTFAGEGESFSVTVGENGAVRFCLPERNQFTIYQYQILK